MPPDKVPLGSLVAYICALGCLVVLKSWYCNFLRSAEGDMHQTLPALIYVTLLRSACTLDACLDVELLALIYYAWKEGSCTWDGKCQCQLYFTLLIITAVAAGTDYIISLAFALIPAAGRGRQRIALHMVSMLCEMAMLTVTVLVEKQVYVADNAAGAPSVTRRLSLQLFIITTAAVTAITFVGSLMGLRDIMRMSSAAVATLSFRTKSEQGQKRVSWFGRGRICNEDGT